ncbi:NAD(P)/FAD-dependent oxidoreductase [Nocardioides limicola]|uniref:NAD(P)/FAD-dependent oxidoreductase n=1 Tax=Nocardioides limicola TaxID=2803368 RepID=UPI00193C500E|nr:NAD(P)/FAD-dependent oxidoreductase [Nocardioides sp. DJM-14]
MDERRDVIVVGGGAAGLSAALMLARARRTVTVIDGGAPRNAPADGVHGLLGHEGMDPRELLVRGRSEVTSYGGQVRDGVATQVAGAADGFTVTLSDGAELSARRLLIATGLVDELPEVPGLRERWGRSVLHCPYCHGWEVRDQRIGVLASGPMSVHQALLFRQWSQHVLFFVGDVAVEPEDTLKLDAVGIEVVTGGVTEVGDGHPVGVQLDDGRVVDMDAVVVAPRMVARADLFAGIGIEPSPHPMGSFIESDPTGRTQVPGVWVAGNAADLSAQVGAAAADGARAAAHINADLVMADAEKAVTQIRAAS